MGIRLTDYQKRAVIQGEQWVAGKSIHEKINDECCPDFSCCYPRLFEKDRAKRIQIFNKLLESYGMPARADA